MDIDKLIKDAKQGNKDALVQLIMAEKQDYYKLAYTYMRNKEDALDALEDMIVILYESIHRLKKEEAFYSWSKTILVNRCKKLLAKRKSFFSLESVREEASEGGFEQKDEQLILERHMAKLNRKHQEVLKLRYFLDLDYKSISDLLNIPIGTVKSRISIGIRRLKESLGGEGYERS
ncbi:sigma-70 family RNA polymerase sigma factor [Wukongibacter baidiensis]|uniref:sigma-70 family RNA polymerase sigma factor n=1 Tax=Wukongibacter baidiensis TaxID=1723361 RepID=UPI003D7F3EA8